MAPRVNNKKVKGGDTKKGDKNEKTVEENSNDASNSGFGGYLRSEQGNYFCVQTRTIDFSNDINFMSLGMGFMKMFVMMNTLVMLLTMGVPAMKQAYEIVYSWLEEWELIGST